MTKICSVIILCLMTAIAQSAEYKRNEAVPVEKVLFGHIESVRNITEQELIEDQNRGWKTFGGALIGAGIGHQFGSGSGQDIATILGALIGASVAHNQKPNNKTYYYYLVELMIKTEQGEQYLVVQDKDNKMIFKPTDAVRLIYLGDGTVRVDKQL